MTDIGRRRGATFATLIALIVLAMVAAALGGCAVGPNYVKPATPVPGQFADATEGAYTGEDVQARFWTQFQDPTLDRLGLSADAFDGRAMTGRDLAFTEVHAPSGAQIRAHGGVARLIEHAQGCFGKSDGAMFRGPLAHHREQPLAIGTGTRLHQVHAVDARGLTEEPEDSWDRGPHVGSFQQPATGACRSREQSLARLQRLVDPPQGLRTGRGLWLRFQGGGVGIHPSETVLTQREP